ncbi:2-polyprenyl-3-methyl-5-hydroxy-6-metoxy-1,4-benzoquinol methylase [Aeromicrobium sp. SORGH_AS981]|uniref:class I SAM-dependent methyltransferase n=1 Tax=Aeromicrobium sp. SORGH_AS_0981 TaxID=3041802 RepID=UPI0028652273|nr:class I SAM-dependent methyltransferase [Aeromicrobium sp. SORGH_AS_0981]MDR6118582.1 2-polyprenyl-3-methyl-5-hydroxy-6-metoxy-1,4-benzoquinol methylase [Aeromicrobium sp. SORGH_AS_0981]
MPTPRWFTDTDENHSTWYRDRFRDLAAEGADLEGEARLVDALAPRGSRVLDAGCGAGRLGGALHHRGHDVTGVDADEVLVAEARARRPGPTWLVADLLDVDLGAAFDVVVTAGNVMVFLAPGTEQRVVANLARHVADDGALVLGFRLDRHYGLADLDDHLAAAGFAVEQRFSTWDLRPLGEGADFAVTIARRAT